MLKKILFAIITILIYTGCSDKYDSSFSPHNPKNIEVENVYSLNMYQDDYEEYNNTYLKFVPKNTSYYSFHIGTDRHQDLDIFVYSDDEYSKLIAKSDSSSSYGEQLNYQFKEAQEYYILIRNYDNTQDTRYSLLVSASNNDNFYTKDKPMKIKLTDTDVSLQSFVGYDSPLSILDTDQDKHYIHLKSNINSTIYIKTMTIESSQDLDIKVYSDSEYSKLLYESSSVDINHESLKVQLESNKEYFIEVINFTNNAEASFILHFDDQDWLEIQTFDIL